MPTEKTSNAESMPDWSSVDRNSYKELDNNR